MNFRTSFFPRALATCIDCLCIFLPMLVSTSLGIASAISNSAEKGETTKLLLGTIVGVFSTLSTNILVAMVGIGSMISMELFWGRTPGKIMVGLTVAHADGTSCALKERSLRTISKYSGILLFFLAMEFGIPFLDTFAGCVSFFIFIGYFFMLGKQRQAFHDMLSKTVVFNIKNVV